jgi:hypothetical protein
MAEPKEGVVGGTLVQRSGPYKIELQFPRIKGGTL